MSIPPNVAAVGVVMVPLARIRIDEAAPARAKVRPAVVAAPGRPGTGSIWELGHEGLCIWERFPDGSLLSHSTIVSLAWRPESVWHGLRNEHMCEPFTPILEPFKDAPAARSGRTGRAGTKSGNLAPPPEALPESGHEPLSRGRKRLHVRRLRCRPLVAKSSFLGHEPLESRQRSQKCLLDFNRLCRSAGDTYMVAIRFSRCNSFQSLQRLRLVASSLHRGECHIATMKGHAGSKDRQL
jgi:hypothetical protein